MADKSDDMTDKAAEQLLDRLITEAEHTRNHWYRADDRNEAFVREYLPVDPAATTKVVLYFSQELLKAYRTRKELNLPPNSRERVLRLVIDATVDRYHTFNDEDLRSLIGNWHEAMTNDYFWYNYPNERIADQLISKIGQSGMTEPLRQSLAFTKYRPDLTNTKDRRKFNDKIDLLLQGDQELPVNRLDPIGGLILDFIGSIEGREENEQWKRLIKHCFLSQEKTVPPKKWLDDARKIMSQIDTCLFAQKMQEWLGLAKFLLTEAHRSSTYRKDALSENIQELLKALIWYTPFVNSPELVNVLDDYAAIAYRKKPGVGPLSMKTGNACMHAFSLLPVKEGISKLVKFRTKIKNNTILKGIDKIIRELSEKNNVSWDELQEMSVPDFGLDDQGELRMTMGEFVARYSINGITDAQLIWEKEGKIQKAVPATVKDNFAAELKKLKASIKEIETLLPVYKEKIEQSYLRQRTWTYEQWLKHYLQHPLMGILAKKLIWHFIDPRTGAKTQGIWLNDALADVNEKVLHFDGEMEVQLWHPIGFATEEIVAWRNFLQKHRITQPFKQAYREIYVVTDAELTTDVYSNRFAAHVLRHHQFAALCKQRGWQYHLMGDWDSHNTPFIHLGGWNIRVEYLVDADWQGATSGPGVFTYIATDQVRFFEHNAQLSMRAVPALVFTELMRDIDLFVGVTSIGNDPSWQDGGDVRADTYWHNYSFSDLSESAKIRAEILKGLIPRLKITGKCTFEARYLQVQGKLRSYKIHLGSGNILMDPDDRYLCIVPERSHERSTDKLFLPFEGDGLLSIILSKALLLAEDDKITDPTIVR